MGFNRFYEQGIHVGAVAAGEWSITQYQSLADQLWKGARDDVPYAVIEIARDGAKFAIGPFTDLEAAADRYGRSAERPDWATYVALYSRNVPAGEIERREEAFFRPTEIVKTERVPFAVKAGMGIAAAFGLLALLAKH